MFFWRFFRGRNWKVDNFWSNFSMISILNKNCSLRTGITSVDFKKVFCGGSVLLYTTFFRGLRFSNLFFANETWIRRFLSVFSKIFVSLECFTLAPLSSSYLSSVQSCQKNSNLSEVWFPLRRGIFPNRSWNSNFWYNTPVKPIFLYWKQVWKKPTWDCKLTNSFPKSSGSLEKFFRGFHYGKSWVSKLFHVAIGFFKMKSFIWTFKFQLKWTFFILKCGRIFEIAALRFGVKASR